MDEIGFRIWLSKANYNKKVQGDSISRLKRIERELEIDLDEQYKKDNMEDIMKAFLNMGNNEQMSKYGNVDFPVGKYYMSTYRYSLKQYIKYKNE